MIGSRSSDLSRLVLDCAGLEVGRGPTGCRRVCGGHRYLEWNVRKVSLGRRVSVLAGFRRRVQEMPYEGDMGESEGNVSGM